MMKVLLLLLILTLPLDAQQLSETISVTVQIESGAAVAQSDRPTMLSPKPAIAGSRREATCAPRACSLVTNQPENHCASVPAASGIGASMAAPLPQRVCK